METGQSQPLVAALQPVRALKSTGSAEQQIAAAARAFRGRTQSGDRGDGRISSLLESLL